MLSQLISISIIANPNYYVLVLLSLFISLHLSYFIVILALMLFTLCISYSVTSSISSYLISHMFFAFPLGKCLEQLNTYQNSFPHLKKKKKNNITVLMLCCQCSITSLYRRQLVSTESCDDNMVSYGVRNSIAAYLSFSRNQQPTQMGAESRKKKSKSLYVLPESSLTNTDYDEDF